jgi:shikimate 5-dehydrogenase
MKLVKEHCDGASITMPFKKQVEKYLDMNWASYMPVNTVVNKDKFLTGYNCDYLGIVDLLKERVQGKEVVILGHGAMADNFSLLCLNAKKVSVVDRKNWHNRHDKCDVLINATSIGMGTNETPVDKINASLVVDCVIGDTELIKQAHAAGKAYIRGSDIYLAQFKHQFKLYTGQDADQDVVKLIAKKVFDV